MIEAAVYMAVIPIEWPIVTAYPNKGKIVRVSTQETKKPTAVLVIASVALMLRLCIVLLSVLRMFVLLPLGWLVVLCNFAIG